MVDISLSIGENFTIFSQLKENNNQIEIINIDKTSTLNDFYTLNNQNIINNQANLIKKLLENNKITNKHSLHIIIPDSYSYNQTLLMPSLNEKELISAIKYQADQFIPIPIDETNIDLEIIEEYSQEKKLLILIAAASKKIIDKIQNTIQIAGYFTQSLETETSAISRFIYRFFNNNKNFLVINFSSSTTSFYYYEGNPPLLKKIRNINLGYNLILKQLKINTDINEEQAKNLLSNYNSENSSSINLEQILEALIKEFIIELEKFISDKTNKIEGIYLMNNICLFPYFKNLIEKLLNYPVFILNPEKFFKQNQLLTKNIKDIQLYISTFGGLI